MKTKKRVKTGQKTPINSYTREVQPSKTAAIERPDRKRELKEQKEG